MTPEVNGALLLDSGFQEEWTGTDQSNHEPMTPVHKVPNTPSTNLQIKPIGYGRQLLEDPQSPSTMHRNILSPTSHARPMDLQIPQGNPTKPQNSQNSSNDKTDLENKIMQIDVMNYGNFSYSRSPSPRMSPKASANRRDSSQEFKIEGFQYMQTPGFRKSQELESERLNKISAQRARHKSKNIRRKQKDNKLKQIMMRQTSPMERDLSEQALRMQNKARSGSIHEQTQRVRQSLQLSTITKNNAVTDHDLLVNEEDSGHISRYIIIILLYSIQDYRKYVLLYTYILLVSCMYFICILLVSG